MRWITLIFFITVLNCTAQVVQNFSLVNVSDGKSISLEDYSSSPGIVIIFTSINCPYDEYYISRMKELAEKSNSKTPVLLINSSSNESVNELKRFVERNAIVSPYLIDHEKKAFAILKPRKSPECFLLQNRAGKFNVVYRGAIDDNPQTGSEVNQSYLRNAIENMLANQKIAIPDVRPVGCSIPKN